MFFIYFYEVLAKIVVQVGRGRVGQKEKRELAHLILATLYIDISFIMKDPRELFRVTMLIS